MNAVDMSQFIAARSDQLNADDLLGGPRTITITGVRANPDSAEQPVSIAYAGDGGKPFKPCKTIRRVMVGAWGPDASKYIGRSMTLFRDPKVAFGGMQVGGIRISHMSHIDGKLVLPVQVSKGHKKPYEVEPLVADVRQLSGDDPVRKWSAAYIAKVEQAPDLATLTAHINAKAARLEEMRALEPELHSQCVAAVEKRRRELGWGDDAATGKIAEAWQPTADRLGALIDAATDTAGLDAAQAEYQAVLRDMPDLLPKGACDALEAKLGARKAELGGQ